MDDLYIIVLIIAVGFAFIITKLNKAIMLISYAVSVLAGAKLISPDDLEELRAERDEENEDG